MSNDWENPSVIEKNRLPTRAYSLPNEHLSLNGEWDFHYAPTPQLALEPDECASFNDWNKIQVPGHWQLQGYGIPHYTNVIYPFPVDPPYVPSDNPTGTYRRTFSVPSQWKEDASLRLRFDGVDSAYYVFVDGNEVGYSQGSRNCAEFDISEVLRNNSEKKEHTLVVRVIQWSDGSYIEDQDQWWLSGIFRDVILLAFDKVGHIEDFSIEPVFDSKYLNADLNVELKVLSTQPTSVSLDLRTKSDKKLVKSETLSIDDNSDMSTVTTSMKIEQPHHWTAEDPFLYEIEMTLLSSTGIALHIIKHNVGFRQVEMINGNITVNGRAILFRGVNRHEMHPKYGRAVPFEFMKQDLLLMKQYNINAVRCSHYPNHPLFYDVCDELGLWVVDEADLECHGMYDVVARPLDIPEEMDYEERKRLCFTQAASYTSDNPDWREAYLDRARQMVYRDRNHPCIVVWSLGNEAFYGSNHAAMYKLIKSLDPARPVHYEGDIQAKTADVFSMMYPSLEVLKDFAAKFGDKFEKPLILCEYAHAMGNGPGGMKEYQDLFYKERILQGGFVWEWANHGLLKKDEKSGKEFYAYGGDFGEYPHDGTFVMDGLLNARHEPTPGLPAFKEVIKPVSCSLSDGNLDIKNLYDFISLDHLNLEWVIKEYNGLKETVKKNGQIQLGKIEAQASMKVSLNEIIGSISPVGETWISFDFKTKQDTNWAKKGHSVATHQEKLGGQSVMTLPSGISESFGVTENKTEIIVENKLTKVQFNKILGRIESWKVGSTELIIPGDNSLTFWRPLTDNDQSSDGPYWKRFGLDKMRTSVRSVSITKSNDSVSIETDSYIAPPILNWGFMTKVIYKIFNGNIRISTCLSPQTKTEAAIPKTLPRVGWEFSIPSSFTKSQWFGLGPGESYSDKRDGVFVGLFEEDTTNFDYLYDVPQETGNRSETRQFWIGSGKNGITGSLTSKGKEHLFGFKSSNSSNIDDAKHPYEIIEGPLKLRVDYAQHGVGSAACGPGVLPPYILNTEQFEFDLDLVASHVA